MSNKALITDIQRFSIHDGPGIRTTIFFKGCPLACKWCHNPETIRFQNELIYSARDCIGCGDCVVVCQEKAIILADEKLTINREICKTDFKCTDICPGMALKPVAHEYDPSRLLEKVMRDLDWYDDTGGITLSGGEPLVHAEFLKEFLLSSKEKGLHITVETCGYWRFETVKPLFDMTDLILMDIKLMDQNKHIEYTGKSNELIIHNLRQLIDKGYPVDIRMPVVPGVNDDNENLNKTCELLTSLSIPSIVLLPYHTLGKSKIPKIDYKHQQIQKDALSKEALDRVRQIIESSGIEAMVGT